MINSEFNIIINLCVILLGVGASIFPLKWRRVHNGDYEDGFRLILPTLAILCLGNIIFGVLYILRLQGVIADPVVQKYGRMAIILFFAAPFWMVFSLHYWKK